MSILVSGSLAFDAISNFPGRFADQILPDKLHILNVSFLVPTLRRDWGGCAGNIAYNLAQLGNTPVVAAAVGAAGRAIRGLAGACGGFDAEAPGQRRHDQYSRPSEDRCAEQ